MQPPTDQELDELPHVVLTSDQDWDPTTLDHEYPAIWPEDIPPRLSDAYIDKSFDSHGNYLHWHVLLVIYSLVSRDEPPLSLDDAIDSLNVQLSAHGHVSQVKEPNYEALRPCIAWAPLDIIKRTFSATTQYARNVYHLPFRKHFKSRFPALNVHRHQEPVATNTVYADTPAIDDGSTCAQIFVGHESLVTDIYGMKTDKEFVNTLEDNICHHGAMDKSVTGLKLKPTRRFRIFFVPLSLKTGRVSPIINIKTLLKTNGRLSRCTATMFSTTLVLQPLLGYFAYSGFFCA